VDALRTQSDIVIERLSPNTWLLHPLTKLVVLVDSVLQSGTDDRIIRLRMFVPPAYSIQPQFRAVILAAGERQELSGFQEAPEIAVPLKAVGRGVLRIEARDSRQPDKAALTVDFDWQYLGWLDASPGLTSTP